MRSNNRAKAVLISADNAICAFFIEDATRLRRIIQLMPEGDLPVNFLNTLWAYAVKHDRLFDLANALLGFDSCHKTVAGNENCDWFWQSDLPDGPEQANNFFYELMTYARTRAHLARGTYDDWHGSSIAMFEWMEYYKRFDVGKGIIDIDYVLDQLLSKYESEVELERRLDMEDGRPKISGPVTNGNEQINPDGRIFVGFFEMTVSGCGDLCLPDEFTNELGRSDMCVMCDPMKRNALTLVPADYCEQEISRLECVSLQNEDLLLAYKQAVRVKVDPSGRIKIPLELLSIVCPGNNGKVILRGYISRILIFNISNAPKKWSALSKML